MTAPLPHTALAPLLQASVAIALGDWARLRDLRRQATPDRAWREAVLQTHLFAGFPRLVQAYTVLAEEGGLGEPGPEEAEPKRSEAQRIEAGMELFEVIYGSGAPRIRDMLAGFHPDWADHVLGHAYGRVLTRGGINAAQRELLAVVCLAALDQERQLASHARGAIRCGATADELFRALEVVAPQLPSEVHARATKVLVAFASA